MEKETKGLLSEESEATNVKRQTVIIDKDNSLFVKKGIIPNLETLKDHNEVWRFVDYMPEIGSVDEIRNEEAEDGCSLTLIKYNEGNVKKIKFVLCKKVNDVHVFYSLDSNPDTVRVFDGYPKKPRKDDKYTDILTEKERESQKITVCDKNGEPTPGLLFLSDTIFTAILTSANGEYQEFNEFSDAGLWTSNICNEVKEVDFLEIKERKSTDESTGKPIDKPTDIPASIPTDYIIKDDLYISSTCHWGLLKPTDRVILDGGDLIRYQHILNVPERIICKNGTLRDISFSKYHKDKDDYTDEGRNFVGASHSIIEHPNGLRDTNLRLFGAQNNVIVEFDPADFILGEDYKANDSAMTINLNNVLERIFKNLYNGNSVSGQRMTIKMPATHYGALNYYLDRTLTIPNGVTLDMSGATVTVNGSFLYEDFADNGLKAKVARKNGKDHIIDFDTNRVIPNLCSATIKNVEIRLQDSFFALNNFILKTGGTISKDIDDVMEKKVEIEDNSPTKVTHVIDLTNFSCVLENVTVNLNGDPHIIAFKQPFGTPDETYSDEKIIRRCRVVAAGWRNETPTAIFCYGDGCIIEQCTLGYVAIICGNSYTIRGCLNDSYFIYDSTVDFTGSYWEIGQFQFLNSKVRFSECKLDCANNNFQLSSTAFNRSYIGPWMAIDTDNCRERLKYMVDTHKLGIFNFNEIDYTNKEETPNYRRFLARTANYHSTVVFTPTVRSATTYWGYMQPMSGPLFKTGGDAEIIGLENLAFTSRIFIHNYINGHDDVLNELKIPVRQAATMPLVNGDFYDGYRTAVEVPDNVTLNVSKFNVGLKPSDDMSRLGLDWNGETLTKVSMRFLLDRQRNLYSREYTCEPTSYRYGDILTIKAYVSPDKRYRNLKSEVTLIMKGSPIMVDSPKEHRYVMRNHVRELSDTDILSFGTKPVESVTDRDVELFNIMVSKAYNSYDDYIAQKSDYNGQKKSDVEPVVNFGDIALTERPKKAEIDKIFMIMKDCLCDWCGNYSMPSVRLETDPVNEATRIEWIGDNNVRAYMSKLPESGTWNNGDEVLLPTSINRYYNGRWLSESTKIAVIKPEL